jgi:hypothetical protein
MISVAIKEDDSERRGSILHGIHGMNLFFLNARGTREATLGSM